MDVVQLLVHGLYDLSRFVQSGPEELLAFGDFCPHSLHCVQHFGLDQSVVNDGLALDVLKELHQIYSPESQILY